MTKKDGKFNYLPWVTGALALIAILLIIRNTEEVPKQANQEVDVFNDSSDPNKATEDSLSKMSNEQPEVSVGFLKLSEDEIDSLPSEMADYYRMIISTKNFASGNNIIPVMKSLNDLINLQFEKYGIDTIEDESLLQKSMEGLKINPRVSADHFNNGGRVLLQKLYLLQDKAYPKLSIQLREIKSALGELPSSGSLEGNGFEVKEFFDESFIFFYIAWEDVKDGEV